jgi:hypothetical protein
MRMSFVAESPYVRGAPNAGNYTETGRMGEDGRNPRNPDSLPPALGRVYNVGFMPIPATSDRAKRAHRVDAAAKQVLAYHCRLPTAHCRL